MSKRAKIIIGLFLCSTVLFTCEEIFRRQIGGFAGSFPFAETWTFNVRESELIQIIKELKNEDSTLKVPKHLEFPIDLQEGRTIEYNQGFLDSFKIKFLKDSTLRLPKHTFKESNPTDFNSQKGYWYFIDFYYPSTQEIVHTWTRPEEDSNSTTLALISFQNTGNPDYPEYINQDFWYVANKIQIWKFETRIVDKIKRLIKQRKKSST